MGSSPPLALVLRLSYGHDLQCQACTEYFRRAEDRKAATSVQALCILVASRPSTVQEPETLTTERPGLGLPGY